MASQHIIARLSGFAQLAVAKTTGVAVFLRVSRSRANRATAPAAPPPAPASGLPIERDDPDLVERAVVARHVARLMLDDEWTEIADQIGAWEADLASTPGGIRYHDIAAEVALSGLQSLIDDMPHAHLGDLAEAEVELGHFLDTYRQAPDSHVLALLAARAHLVIGQACRADHWPREFHRDAWRRMARHYVAAGEILKAYDALAFMSPLLAEAHYLQALGSPAGSHKLPELFEDWIDLDPANPAIYERHAEYLCDGRRVSDETILSEADKALERTEETLGFGGYALFFLPLLDQREGARRLLDPDLFASAMLDLAAMSASQSEVNQTASALAAELRATGSASLALSDTLYMLIRSYLQVIYPRHWTMPLDAVQRLVSEAVEVIPDAMHDPSADLDLRAA